MTENIAEKCYPGAALTKSGENYRGMNGQRISSAPAGPEIKGLLTYQPDRRYSDALTALRGVIDRPGMRILVDNTGNTPNKDVMRAVQKRAKEVRTQFPGWEGPVVTTMAVLHTAFEEDFTNEDVRHEALFVGADMRAAVRDGRYAGVITNPDGTQMRLEEFSDNLFKGPLRPDAVIVTLSPVINEPEGYEVIKDKKGQVIERKQIKGRHNGLRTMGIKGADMVEVFDKIREERRLGVPQGKNPIQVVALERDLPVPAIGESFIHDREVDIVVPTRRVEASHKVKVNPDAKAMAKNAYDAVIKKFERDFPGRKIMVVQSGLGGVTEEMLPLLVNYCKKNDIKLHALTEVASTLVDRLADAGDIEKPVITSFTHEIKESNLIDHTASPRDESIDAVLNSGAKYAMLGTGRINNHDALNSTLHAIGDHYRTSGEDLGEPVFIAVNQATEIGERGRIIAGQVPCYVQEGDKIIKVYKRQGGPGGQKVMMETADISVIIPKATRKANDGAFHSAINFETDGAEITTPQAHIYASEIGSFEFKPGDTEEARRANNLGLIEHVAAPEFRPGLIEQARNKGLLPARPAEPITIFDLYNPLKNPFIKSSINMGMRAYQNWIDGLNPYSTQQTV